MDIEETIDSNIALFHHAIEIWFYFNDYSFNVINVNIVGGMVERV